MKFELSPLEIERKDNFYKKCKRKTKGEDVRMQFIFTPTGIGDNVKVRSITLNIEEEITDYNSW